MEPMIEVRNLFKTFGPRAALAGVDLSVSSGESVILAGPNGAGKTTLLRTLATLTRSTSGTIRIGGLDPVRAGIEVRRRIGFLSHRTLLYEDLTAEQNLRFYGRMYELDDVLSRTRELLERVGLATRGQDLVRTFSRGMKQRLAVARAVLHSPEVLLLDEPYTGLDPNASEVLTDLLVGLAGEGCTILLTTHNIGRGLTVGSRIVVLVEGRVVYDVPRADLEMDTFPQIYRELTA